ncbi:MAG: hypothetical protein Q9227_006125 [Pyrenula ochraceoflavens]
MPTYLITGASRGLGLEFTLQLSHRPNTTILATCRSPASARHLKAHAAASPNIIKILPLDTSSPSSIADLAEPVRELIGAEGKIDVLFNNAGINDTPEQSSTSMTAESLQRHMNVNVLGPAELTRTLLPHLQSGSIVVNMTSGLGSCGMKNVKCTTYSISKAALNMLTVHQAGNLRERGVRVICMDPGWVKTEMGGEGAVMEARESIEGMLRVVGGVGEGESGRFWRWDGEELPW